MSKDTRSTTKGIKVGVNSVTCCFCDYVPPAESVPKDILPAMNNCRNLGYICDGCLRSFDGLKTLTKPILDKNDEIELEIKKISEHTTALCKDFCELKQLVVANGDRLNQINSVDNTLDKSFDNFKQQMNESWTGIVKQGIDAVKNDVKIVQRTLEVVNTIKERENNVIIFNLIESNRKDNDSVSAILRSLTDNSIKDDDILRGKLMIPKLHVQLLLNSPVLSSKTESCVGAKSVIAKFNVVYQLLSGGLDIFLLCETLHGSPEDPSIQLAMPPGFSFLQVLRPHDPYHGGLIVFFKKMFKARKIEVPVFQTFEAIIVEFSFKRRKVFVFGICRPGSKLVTSLFFGELTSVLEHLFALGDGLIVAGDFKIHIERPGDTHSINLLEIFDSFQLTNVVNELTHNLGGTLDLVASTPDIPLSNCRVDPSGVYSDHGLINVSFSKYNNFKWFCDTCNNVSPDIKSSTEIDTDLLAKAVGRSKQELMIKIDGLTDASKIIESELRNIRCAVKLNDEKLSNINHAFDEMRTGSGANVEKKLNDATDIEKREKNLVLFRLAEGDGDKEPIMTIFNHLTRNEVAEKAVVKVTRLGKKQEKLNIPLLISLDGVESKNLIMDNVSRMKSLDDVLKGVWPSHDLSNDQRDELKKLINDAKKQESVSGYFLFKVRGPP
ncbi:hypothetical protein HELRODRAFT_169169 [Helobdella robusta]|uniref:Endonuclease/exonuclease/phosphatase domain-containing protein n=1 Tax=Helobdella robusta TaxID=6412 RepID=T1F1I7_HELRO|nr:hypothetical protein HELRODRAFT_169169 [Helobdella robusta]ESO08357.1 hypothetical protein HELRODRAFT_169169 [Helobdella robusta]